jgi:hypothetical protein
LNNHDKNTAGLFATLALFALVAGLLGLGAIFGVGVLVVKLFEL